MGIGLRARCVKTNTGVRYGGFSPHQPFHFSSGHGTAHRPEHIAAKNPRPYVFESTRGKIVVNSRRAAFFSVYPLKPASWKKPLVQFQPAHANRVFQALARPRAVSIDRNPKRIHLTFAIALSVSRI